MKKLLVIIIAMVLSLGFMSVGHAEEQSDKAYLFFTHSTKDGFYFEEYTAQGETVTIFIGKNDFKMKRPVRGDVYIGTFEQWELQALKKVSNIYF